MRRTGRKTVSIHYGWVVAGAGFAVAAASAGGALLPTLFLPKPPETGEPPR